jgi:hypothetical protein
MVVAADHVLPAVDGPDQKEAAPNPGLLGGE